MIKAKWPCVSSQAMPEPLTHTDLSSVLVLKELPPLLFPSTFWSAPASSWRTRSASAPRWALPGVLGPHTCLWGSASAWLLEKASGQESSPLLRKQALEEGPVALSFSRLAGWQKHISAPKGRHNYPHPGERQECRLSTWQLHSQWLHLF